MPKIKRKHIVIFLAAILILYIVTAIIPRVITTVTPTETIEYGNLRVEDEVTCYALRDETVYAAPTSGNVAYTATEGKQMKVGTKIMDFSETVSDSDSQDKIRYQEIADRLGDNAVTEGITTAKRKGVFSTYVDGYESYFTLENFSKITEAKATNRAGQIKDIKETRADKGQPLYKIADQSQWHLMCWVDGGDISRYEVGDSVVVKFGEKETDEIKFTVEEIMEDGEKWKLLLSSNRYYENFAKFRDADVTLITTDIDGIIIDNRYLTTKDGKTGVYVVQTTGEAVFVPVKILGTDGERTAVAENVYYDEEGQMVETVKVYDEILKNPDRPEEKSD